MCACAPLAAVDHVCMLRAWHHLRTAYVTYACMLSSYSSAHTHTHTHCVEPVSEKNHISVRAVRQWLCPRAFPFVLRLQCRRAAAAHRFNHNNINVFL